MKRTFSKEEARQIFADAAERQQELVREADDHLTLDELEESALAAGIDPAHVRAAAEHLVRPAHSSAQRSFLGVPVENRRSVTLPFQVGDEEWGRIVVELRSVFGKRGLASDVGAIREWVSDANEHNSPIRVTAEPEGEATRLTIERSTLSRILGFGGGSMSILLTAVILLSIAVGGGEADVFIPAFIMLMVGILFATGVVVGSRASASRDTQRFEEAVRRIRQIEGGKRTDDTLTAAGLDLPLETASATVVAENQITRREATDEPSPDEEFLPIEPERKPSDRNETPAPRRRER